MVVKPAHQPEKFRQGLGPHPVAMLAAARDASLGNAGAATEGRDPRLDFNAASTPDFRCGSRDVDGHPLGEPTGRCQSAARNTADCTVPRLRDQMASAVTSAEVPGISTPECN